MRRRVVIIGGGISGLAAAHHLLETAAETDVLLLEAGARLGGVIQTTKQDGFLLESAADNFITTSPAAVNLCRRLGIDKDLIYTNPAARRAMVVSKSKLEPIPAGFLVMAPSRIWPLLSTRVLSPMGKLRAGLEYFVPRKKRNDDESLRSFVCRRFGREMFERLVQPLVGAIYTADPRRLSVAATMPRFVEMEREYGSLIRAMLRRRRARGNKFEQDEGVCYSQFMTLRGGMSTLIDALAARLPAESIRVNSPACSVVHSGDDWSIRMGRGEQPWIKADGVIVAAPASRSSGMLTTVDPRMAQELGNIEFASCAVVSLAYSREQVGHRLGSFGFVVPQVEHRHILSCSFSSLKYEGRAPEGMVLMRVFVGGAVQRGLMRLSDHELTELAHWELARLLDIKGEPLMRQMTRQLNAMPQYNVGHCERVATIERRLQQFPTLALAGNSLSSFGVPGCIASGESAAQRIVSALAPATKQPLCI